MKRIVFIFLSAALIATVVFLPQLCSTKWVKNQIIAHLEEQIGGEIEIDHLSLGWGKKQSCHGIYWKDTKKGFALSADQLNIASTLFDCIKHKEKPLELVVSGARASCEANLRLIKKKKHKQLEMHFSPIYATVHKGHVTFERTQIDVTESLQIVTWGSVNLEDQSMDLIFGLPPKTLKKLFRAKDLPEDYLMEIPIDGKLNGKAIENHLVGYFLKNLGTLNSLSK